MAAPPLVNPVVVAIGATVHLTPIDQNGNPIPIAECVITPGTSGTINPISPSIATIAYDSTGANITGVAAGEGAAYWTATAPGGGGASVNSAIFIIQVPWDVTAVGDTSP